MKPGRSSRTALLVCMGRAVAHATKAVLGFDDPTANVLLPENARQSVKRFLSGAPPKSLRERLLRRYLGNLSRMMAVRTIAIDKAIRAAARPQMITLGAGYDGRAWRMPELADTIVFEVDHPDSQREKRSRIAVLAQSAREVRFVPVDFECDSLNGALAAAGHDSDRPTDWLWEGVVMYLTPDQVRATLEVVERRSAAGSRLVVAYHRPALWLRPRGMLLRWLGEPLRSALTADAMRVLLEQHRYRMIRDETLPAHAAEFPEEVRGSVRRFRHLRIAIATFG